MLHYVIDGVLAALLVAAVLGGLHRRCPDCGYRPHERGQ